MLFPPKITPEKVRQAVDEANRRHPGKPVTVLLDKSMSLPGLCVVDCRTTSLEDFGGSDFGGTTFVPACESDELVASFVEVIIARGSVFHPVFESTPSLYIHTNDRARRVLEQEYEDQLFEGFAKWDYGPHDFINLIQALDMTAHLAGDFIELGCYRGSSGCVVVRYLKEIGLRRTCHFFDVFEGFTYDQAQSSADSFWCGSHKTEGKEIVEKRLCRHEAPAKGATVFVHKSNIIDHDLPAGIGPIVVANIDVDLYEAVLAGLHKVAPRMVRGGVIVVEDPGHTPLLIGARVAFNQFLKSPAAAGFLPVYMQSGQTFLINMNPVQTQNQELPLKTSALP